MQIRKFIHNFLKMFGQKLNVAFDEGNKNGTPLVFLHGIAATSRTWEPLRYKLDYTKYRIIALDLLGFGDSPKPENCNYTAEDQAKYVKRTLAKLKVKKPFILIGHSMGSIITSQYNEIFPDDASRLILVSLPLYIDNVEGEKFQDIALTKAYRNAFKMLENNQDLTIQGSKTLRSLLKIPDGIEVNHRTWLSFRKSLINTIEKQNTYSQLANQTKPIDLIYGNLDEFLVKGSLEFLANKNKNITSTVVAGADHAVSDKLADAIVKTIEN
jgi:pimeloyl-ACP methyl ester carboxylesterase